MMLLRLTFTPPFAGRASPASVAFSLALGLFAVTAITAAHAGDCSAVVQVAPVAAVPGGVDNRAVTSATLVPTPEANDDATATAPSETTESTEPAHAVTTGRPTGPEVRPCRHLPREQVIECLRTTAAG